MGRPISCLAKCQCNAIARCFQPGAYLGGGGSREKILICTSLGRYDEAAVTSGADEVPDKTGKEIYVQALRLDGRGAQSEGLGQPGVSNATLERKVDALIAQQDDMMKTLVLLLREKEDDKRRDRERRELDLLLAERERERGRGEKHAAPSFAVRCWSTSPCSLVLFVRRSQAIIC